MPEGSSKWTLNLQTLVTLAGIAGVLIAWGYTLSGLQRDTDRNTANVATLMVRMEQNDSKTDQHEIRLKSVEKIAEDAAHLRRELDGSLAQLKSDVAVIKSTLERMEKKP